MCARRQNMRGDSAILLALQEDFARLSHPAFIRAHGWGPWVRHGNRRRTNCTSSFSTPTLGRGPSLDYGPCALTLHYDTRTALPPSATYLPFLACLDGLPEPIRGMCASVITVLSLWLDCVHVLLNLLFARSVRRGHAGFLFCGINVVLIVSCARLARSLLLCILPTSVGSCCHDESFLSVVCA